MLEFKPSIPVLRPSRAKSALRSLAFHITMRLIDSRVLATTAAARRDGSRCILRIGASRGLLVHALVDTHLHLVARLERAEAGRLARIVGSALQKVLRLDAPFEPARFIAVTDQPHLYSVVPYVLRQQARHRLDTDPFHDGSTLPDLLGWRVVDGGPACVERMQQQLPRFSRSELWRIASETAGDARAADARRALHHIADASAGAVGLGAPDGSARTAAVHAGTRLGLSTQQLASALDISERTVHRMRRAAIDPALVNAVGWQLAVRAAKG